MRVKVKMADLQVARKPNILYTSGLGSCIGIALYDPRSGLGGMAHIMLPMYREGKGKNREKYADTALDILLDTMTRNGVKRSSLVAKIAGGAQMFSFPGGGGSHLKIGARNTQRVKELLEEKNIPLKGEDTGKNYGRTMELHTQNGIVLIKTVKGESKKI